MYIPPSNVTSPQVSVADVYPIVDKGEHDWSVALLTWDGSPALGVRWNGGDVSGRNAPHPGTPQSRGLPTWFIVPDLLVPAILHTLLQHGVGGDTIDAEQARKKVEMALRAYEVAKTSMSESEEKFVQQIRDVVKAMKEAGEI